MLRRSRHSQVRRTKNKLKLSGDLLSTFFVYVKEKQMSDIIYQEGLTWSKADFRLKIQYSMSVLLVVAGVLLAFLSFFIMHEIGMGVLSASTLFIGSALGIYGIGMMVKNQLVDMQVQVDKKIRDLDRREHEYERKRNAFHDMGVRPKEKRNLRRERRPGDLRRRCFLRAISDHCGYGK